MTDRHSGYVVVLARDIREDDAEHVINAIRMIKGVRQVTPVISGVIESQIAETRRDSQWRDALLTLVEKGPAQ